MDDRPSTLASRRARALATTVPVALGVGLLLAPADRAVVTQGQASFPAAPTVGVPNAVPRPPARPAREHMAAHMMRGERVGWGSVTPGALRLIPGIGPARARTLVAAREGERLDCGTRPSCVHGVGPTLSTRLEHYVDFSAGDPDPSARRRRSREQGERR